MMMMILTKKFKDQNKKNKIINNKINKIIIFGEKKKTKKMKIIKIKIIKKIKKVKTKVHQKNQ